MSRKYGNKQLVVEDMYTKVEFDDGALSEVEIVDEDCREVTELIALLLYSDIIGKEPHGVYTRRLKKITVEFE